MQKRIAFRRMEHSAVLEDFLNTRLEKFNKILSGEKEPVSVNVVLEAHPTHAYNKVEITVDTPDYNLIAHHEGPDFYVEIDLVCDKMLNEIRRAKEKKVSEQKKKEWHRP